MNKRKHRLGRVLECEVVPYCSIETAVPHTWTTYVNMWMSWHQMVAETVWEGCISDMWVCVFVRVWTWHDSYVTRLRFGVVSKQNCWLPTLIRHVFFTKSHIFVGLFRTRALKILDYRQELRWRDHKNAHMNSTAAIRRLPEILGFFWKRALFA